MLSQIAARQTKLTSPVLGAVGSNNSSWMNTISITGPNNYNSNDLTLDWFSESKNVKKYEVYETSEDVLALSVTWHRIRSGSFIPPLDNPTKLTDEILFKEMTQEDRERANDIRDYYSKKLMMLTLKEHRISNYRKDLSIFIHGDSKLVKEEMMPLIYRLPEFYDYDIGIDKMFRELNTRFEGISIASENAISLYPVSKFTVNRKSRKYVEYWLKDEQNIPYRIEVEQKNQLIQLWDYFFEKESVTLSGVIKFEDRDGINYYSLSKWTIKH